MVPISIPSRTCLSSYTATGSGCCAAAGVRLGSRVPSLIAVGAVAVAGAISCNLTVRLKMIGLEALFFDCSSATSGT